MFREINSLATMSLCLLSAVLLILGGTSTTTPDAATHSSSSGALGSAAAATTAITAAATTTAITAATEAATTTATSSDAVKRFINASATLHTAADAITRHRRTRQQPLPAVEYRPAAATRRGGPPGAPRNRRRPRRYRERIALWIDQQQVQLLSGYPMDIYVIREGRVLPYILDPHFDRRLPVIPAEVSSFNFTWQGGRRKRYRYQLDNLVSDDLSIMGDPTVSIPSRGRLPRRPRGFSINLPCARNASGVATFSVRLKLKTRHNKRVQGTPLNVRLRKRCAPIELLEESSHCPVGYLGANCSEALCYPLCEHGGHCSAPGRCSCRPGYHGSYCQGGICTDKCLNGGKCIQKDRCSCTRGFFGATCQRSKCTIPCTHGGVCRGVNKCRCPQGYGGHQCDIIKNRGGLTARLQRCQLRCRRGTCDDVTAVCTCADGFSGRWCRRRNPKHGRRVWL